jgi:hypothetical protein
MCFNCGKDGHISRFCSEYRGYPQGYDNNQNRAQHSEDNQANNVAINTAPVQATGGQNTIPGPRITEVPDMAAIEVLGSAAGGVRVVKKMVKYLDTVEAYVGERRRRSEMTSGGNSIVRRARKRQTVAPPGRTYNVAADPDELSTRPPPQVLQDSSPELTDIEMEPRPPPRENERTQKKTPRQPKAPLRIRMMIGETGFDVLAEFRDMPVNNLKWGRALGHCTSQQMHQKLGSVGSCSNCRNASPEPSQHPGIVTRSE